MPIPAQKQVFRGNAALSPLLAERRTGGQRLGSRERIGAISLMQTLGVLATA